MAPLLTLPVELLLKIHDYLPPDAILSLKLTHPTLNDALPALPQLRNKTLSNCARFAVERYRARPDGNPSHLRCILCKNIYPTKIFASSSSPACIPLSFINGAPRPEVVELPPSYCSWHVSRLARVIRTEAGGRNEWVSDMKRMCMHDSCIQGWSECECDCDSCGYRMIRTYTRYLNNNTECKRFQFWRNPAAGESEDPSEKAKGRLYIRETCWNNATEQQSTIDFPVHYQDQAKGVLETPRNRSALARPERSTNGSFCFDKFTITGAFLNMMPS